MTVACIFSHLAIETRDGATMTALRLLAVLNVRQVHLRAPSVSRLVLTPPRTSCRHVGRNAGSKFPAPLRGLLY